MDRSFSPRYCARTATGDNYSLPLAMLTIMAANTAGRVSIGASNTLNEVGLNTCSGGIFILDPLQQPDFSSAIPLPLWWAIASFTAVGYQDMSPVTSEAQNFAIFVLLTGSGVSAIFVTSAPSGSSNNHQTPEKIRSKTISTINHKGVS